MGDGRSFAQNRSIFPLILGEHREADFSAVPRVGKIPPAEVRKMDAIEQMGNLRKIGVAVAKTEVNVKEHFGSFLASR